MVRDGRKGSLREAAGEVAVDVGVFRSSAAGAEALRPKSQGRRRKVALYSTVLSPSSSLCRWTLELDRWMWRWKVGCWRLEVGVLSRWELDVESRREGVGRRKMEGGVWDLEVARWRLEDA